MEIAASGFISSLGSAATADASRQRQSPANDRASQSASEQASREQRNQTRTQTSTAAREPESVRVINGEVLSSETSRVRSDQSASSFLGRSSGNQQAPNDQPDTRRVSVSQALQNFSQNEALASDSNNPRQVSGIIDEFV